MLHRPGPPHIGGEVSATRPEPSVIRAHVVGVSGLTAVIAGLYCAYALVLYGTYRDTSYDLVIFDQAIRSYSRFHLGTSIIKGTHNGFGLGFSVLGDHFSPIDMVLAPLYWIHAGPQTLLIAQPVLFALAIPWLWAFTYRVFGGAAAGWKAPAAAYLACLGYGLSWPLANAVSFDYHEVAFAPLLTAIALERLQAGRLRPALIAIGLLLLVKEDMGLLVSGIGGYLAVSPSPTVPRQRLVGVILLVTGVAYTIVAADILIPAFGGRSDYYWAYSNWGGNIPQVIVHMLENPARFFQLMVVPQAKLNTLTWLFAVFCFLPLLSPLTLAALPLLAERMQADSHFPAWWGTSFHYNAFLVAVLVFAAVDGAARLDRWATRLRRYLELRRAGPASVAGAAEPGLSSGIPARSTPRVGDGVVALACCAAICLAAVVALPHFPLSDAVSPGFYQQTPRMKAAAAAEKLVPSGAVVAVADDLGPELSARDSVLMWDGDGYTPPFAAPWVVADTRHPDLGFRNLADQSADVAILEHHGYEVLYQRHGILVLHRPGPPRLGITAHPLHIGPQAAR